MNPFAMQIARKNRNIQVKKHQMRNNKIYYVQKTNLPTNQNKYPKILNNQ